MASARSTFRYRPDIDGLRAIAVIPVVLYHAGVPALSGGFVGVDVFFVISGFLIAGIIRREITQQHFSLAGFYERRARRILPALFIVIGTALVAAWVTAWPANFSEISRSALATVFFGSNFYFWQTTDYFATAAEFRPLLHTWSLAVEEQFYIFFPLFLLLLARQTQRRLVAACLAIFAVSLTGSVLVTSVAPDTAFYSAPLRAWELLLGVLLAVNAVPDWPRRPPREIASIVGLALILGPVFAYDAATIFPGLSAALPCAGTALLIHAGRGNGPATTVSAFLSRPVLVFVGLISYSLYLWHWPILAFARLWLETPQLPAAWTVACVASGVILAALTWWFVERPFRTREIVSRQGILRFSVAGSLALVCLSLSVLVTDGFPHRFSVQALDALAGAEDIEADRRACMGSKQEGEYCIIGNVDVEPSAILLGDSHAAALMSAVGFALAAQDKSGFLASYSACPPLLGKSRGGRAGWDACARFIDNTLAFIEARQDTVSYVLLSARWPLYVSGEHAAGEPGGPISLSRMTGNDTLSDPELVERWLRSFVQRLTAMGIKVIILGGVPEIGWDVPRTIALAEKRGENLPELPTLESLVPRHAEADAILGKVAQSGDVAYVPLAPLLCEPVCQVVADMKPLYVDDDHLSRHGAQDVLGPRLATVLAGIMH